MLCEESHILQEGRGHVPFSGSCEVQTLPKRGNKWILDNIEEYSGSRPRKKSHFLSTKLPKDEPSRFVLAENRNRLKRLLGKLAREQNWKEATGILSTLLKGELQSSPMEIRKIYWATMEVLSYTDDDPISSWKIRSIYEAWLSQNGLLAKHSKNYLIQLEFVLFLLTRGDFEEAYDIIKFLILDSESRSDPLVNMVAGLISYQLWYKSLPSEMQLKKDDACLLSDNHVDIPGSFEKKPIDVEHFDDCSTANAQTTENMNQYISDGSIGGEQNHSANVKFDADLQAPQVFPENGSYSAGGMGVTNNYSVKDEGMMGISIPYPYWLDKNMFPICVPKTAEEADYASHFQHAAGKEHYIEAVKYLRIAIYSNPPVLAALLPLVQLLLLGNNVEEAISEVKKFSLCSNALFPLRLRTTLLECFCGNNDCLLASCYEDILEMDPTCSHSLSALISMYKKGSYGTESLLEMIGLHLDVTYPGAEIWKEFCWCLFRLHNETFLCSDRNSVFGTSWEEETRTILCSSKLISSLFMKDEVKQSWKLRLRWWQTRHFNQKALLLNLEAGNWGLVIFKAACASHFYGPEFYYVQCAVKHLRKNEDHERLLLLDKHIQNSMKLFEKLKWSSEMRHFS